MLGLSKHDQTWFVGIRSTFYRMAMIAGQGLLIILAGSLENTFQSADTSAVLPAGSVAEPGIAFAWAVTFYIMAGLFVLFFAWHRFVLPQPGKDVPAIHETYADVLRDFLQTFAAFFRKPKIGLILAFLLLFRSSEAQLVKIAAPFLLDSPGAGGLCLWNHWRIDADPGWFAGCWWQPCRLLS